MPQFDQFSFLNQVTSIFIIFLSFYFIICYFFLPKLSKNIKFRNKKLLSNKNFSKNIIIEKTIKETDLTVFYQYFLNELKLDCLETKKYSPWSLNWLKLCFYSKGFSINQHPIKNIKNYLCRYYLYKNNFITN